jgi:hypothetical protein
MVKNKKSLVTLLLFLITLSSCSSTNPISEKIDPPSAELLTFQQPKLAAELTKTLTQLSASQRISALASSRIQAYSLLAAYLAYIDSDKTQAEANAVAAARRIAADLYLEVPAVYNSFDSLLKRYNNNGIDREVIDLTTTKIRVMAINDKFEVILSKDFKTEASDLEMVPTLFRWEPTGLSDISFIDPNYGSVKTISDVKGKCDLPPPNLNVVEKEVLELFNKYDPLSGSSENVLTFLAGVGTPTPSGQNLQIITKAAVSKHDVESSLKIVTTSAIAMFDVGILTWHEKKKYMLARPETIYLRLTGKKIYLIRDTPPHPSYPSGHSSFTGANSAVIDRMVKTKEPLELTLPDDLIVDAKTYQFINTIDLQEKVNSSRVESGFHTPYDVKAGAELGRCVGNYVVDNIDTILDNLRSGKNGK